MDKEKLWQNIRLESRRNRLLAASGGIVILGSAALLGCGVADINAGDEALQAALNCALQAPTSQARFCPSPGPSNDQGNRGTAEGLEGAAGLAVGLVATWKAYDRRDKGNDFDYRSVSRYLDRVTIPSDPDGELLYQGRPLPPPAEEWE